MSSFFQPLRSGDELLSPVVQSIIASPELNFRVRNGIGCIPQDKSPDRNGRKQIHQRLKQNTFKKCDHRATLIRCGKMIIRVPNRVDKLVLLG